jgi:hypothetical protein
MGDSGRGSEGFRWEWVKIELDAISYFVILIHILSMPWDFLWEVEFKGDGLISLVEEISRKSSF